MRMQNVPFSGSIGQSNSGHFFFSKFSIFRLLQRNFRSAFSSVSCRKPIQFSRIFAYKKKKKMCHCNCVRLLPDWRGFQRIRASCQTLVWFWLDVVDPKHPGFGQWIESKWIDCTSLVITMSAFGKPLVGLKNSGKAFSTGSKISNGFWVARIDWVKNFKFGIAPLLFDWILRWQTQ